MSLMQENNASDTRNSMEIVDTRRWPDRLAYSLLLLLLIVTNYTILYSRFFPRCVLLSINRDENLMLLTLTLLLACFFPLNRSLENYKRYFKYIYECRDNSIRFIPRPRSIFYPYLLIQHYLNYRNINILHFSTCKHFNKLLNSLSGIFLHEAEQK